MFSQDKARNGLCPDFLYLNHFNMPHCHFERAKRVEKSVLMILSAVLFCIGCGEKEPEQGDAPEINLQVTPGEVSVSSAAQEVVLTVGADADWGVTPVDSWVKTSPTGGGKGETALKVTIEENKSSDERQTTLLFRTGTQKI